MVYSLFKQIDIWVVRRGIMVSKTLLLDQLQRSSAFDTPGVLHTFRFVPHFNHA